MQNSIADVQINSYKKKHSWEDKWTTAFLEELNKEEYSENANGMLSVSIDENNLKELDCTGYNKANSDQKKDFWLVFFSALTRAESAFNEKSRSGISRGHRSFGLLQLASATAQSRCGIPFPISNVLKAENNLKCGIKLMSWQLNGAPVSVNKKLRPDLEGKIFGKYMFQWGPLRQNDARGRKLLVDWFKSHLDQLKFCH